MIQDNITFVTWFYQIMQTKKWLQIKEPTSNHDVFVYMSDYFYANYIRMIQLDWLNRKAEHFFSEFKYIL